MIGVVEWFGLVPRNAEVDRKSPDVENKTSMVENQSDKVKIIFSIVENQSLFVKRQDETDQLSGSYRPSSKEIHVGRNLLFSKPVNMNNQTSIF
jgi:hypothetical protein